MKKEPTPLISKVDLDKFVISYPNEIKEIQSKSRNLRKEPKEPCKVLEFDDSMKSIPISAAKHIADKYGYDQVVIIARRVGGNGGEHVTTYGKDKVHCDVAAKIGDFLKYKVMGWTKEEVKTHE